MRGVALGRTATSRLAEPGVEGSKNGGHFQLSAFCRQFGPIYLGPDGLVPYIEFLVRADGYEAFWPLLRVEGSETALAAHLGLSALPPPARAYAGPDGILYDGLFVARSPSALRRTAEACILTGPRARIAVDPQTTPIFAQSIDKPDLPFSQSFLWSTPLYSSRLWIKDTHIVQITSVAWRDIESIECMPRGMVRYRLPIPSVGLRAIAVVLATVSCGAYRFCSRRLCQTGCSRHRAARRGRPHRGVLPGISS